MLRAEAGPLPKESSVVVDDDDDDDDDDLTEKEEDFQRQQQGHPHRHQSHWRNDGLPSRWVAYYDAASLYPSSGETSFIFSLSPLPPPSLPLTHILLFLLRKKRQARKGRGGFHPPLPWKKILFFLLRKKKRARRGGEKQKKEAAVVFFPRL